MSVRTLLITFILAVVATPVSAKIIKICDLSKPEPNCEVYPDIGTAVPNAGERFKLEITGLTKEQIEALQRTLKSSGFDVDFQIPK